MYSRNLCTVLDGPRRDRWTSVRSLCMLSLCHVDVSMHVRERDRVYEYDYLNDYVTLR